MLWSHCLSHCLLSAISVQWLEVVYEMATFFSVFPKVLEETFCKWLSEFQRRLNEGHLWILDFKKCWSYWKNWGVRAHNFNFKWQFNPSNLFEAQSLIRHRVDFGKNSTKTIRLLWGDSWFSLQPHQLLPHRNLELII